MPLLKLKRASSPRAGGGSSGGGGTLLSNRGVKVSARASAPDAKSSRSTKPTKATTGGGTAKPKKSGKKSGAKAQGGAAPLPSLDEVETPTTTAAMQQDSAPPPTIVDIADPAPADWPKRGFATMHCSVCGLQFRASSASCPHCAHSGLRSESLPPQEVEISVGITMVGGEGGALRAVLDLNVTDLMCSATTGRIERDGP